MCHVGLSGTLRGWTWSIVVSIVTPIEVKLEVILTWKVDVIVEVYCYSH